MARGRHVGRGHGPPDAGPDDALAAPPATATRGGTWLTYRYRLGGEGTPDATGTMKAPTFLSAAHRILARGLGATLGPAPAYLRLRAAGEQEVLLRVRRPESGAGAGPHLEVVPGGTYHFVAPPGAGDGAGAESPPT